MTDGSVSKLLYLIAAVNALVLSFIFRDSHWIINFVCTIIFGATVGMYIGKSKYD